MYHRIIALVVASVVMLLPGTSAGLFHPKRISDAFFLPPGVELLDEPVNQTLITSSPSAAAAAAMPAIENRFGVDASAPRSEHMREFGDQCPQDFIKNYEKNEDICRRCSEHYGDARMGNLCRQNCFTSCYYVRCKNLLECHWYYPTD